MTSLCGLPIKQQLIIFSISFIHIIETIKISYAFIDYSFIILHVIFVYLDNNTYCLFTSYNKIGLY